jgi:hypothetical protein
MMNSSVGSRNDVLRCDMLVRDANPGPGVDYFQKVTQIRKDSIVVARGVRGG